MCFTEGGENCTEHHQDGAAIHGGPLLPTAQEEIPTDYQRPPSPQPQTVLSAAIRRYRSILTRTNRFRDSFIPQAIRQLNT